jgi:iron complex transport system ATP-binding protein
MSPPLQDIAHRVEVLDLVRQMNEAENHPVVMVLHDLSQACRYADYLER